MPRNTKKARKSNRLSPDKLARAQRILGTSTATETIEQALELVAFRREVIDGVLRRAGTKTIKARFRA